MNRITLFKSQSDGAKTCHRWVINDVVKTIAKSRYAVFIHEFREHYPLFLREELRTRAGVIDYQLRDVPRVCFSEEFANHSGEERTFGYNPLLLLQVTNLRTPQMSASLRDRASQLPYTRLAFIGVDAHSVCIVCELHSINSPVDDEDAYLKLLRRGFVSLRKIYSDHLGAQVDMRDVALRDSCYMSEDSELYYNAYSTAFPVDMSENVSREVTPDGVVIPLQVSDREEKQRWQRIYIDNLRKAQQECFSLEDAEFQTLLLLARYCHETGMPQALAESFAMHNGDFYHDKTLIRDTFATEYERELRSVNAGKHLNQNAQLVLRTSNFLNVHYRFRKNMLNNVVEYRRNDGIDFDYHLLTREAQNTMTIEALESGLNSWDKDLSRYLNSDRIPKYDPVNDWLEGLPKWDGKDRIAAIARRIPTITENWEHDFHVWMRSMVAQWMGRDEQHGNAIVPVLIGAQATGKSSFCRILLPEHLMAYYNDSIHFKDDKSVFLALSSFALINIDEFDSLSSRQQPLLKYLISKTDVKYRAAYSSNISQHKRYASFIATTNKQNPLTDPTGSRRFICVKVTGAIDFTTPIDYAQVYAQLRDEVATGERYWFTKEEADAITLRNAPFEKNQSLASMLQTIFRIPADDEFIVPLSIEEIVAEFTSKYPGMELSLTPNSQIGKALTKAGFKQKSNGAKRMYYVVRK